LINAAQRQNTVSSLTASDISRVLPGQQNATQTSVNVVQSTDPQLVAVLAECRTTMERMQKQIENPIEAYVTVSGKNGIDEQTKRYNRLKNNISR
jgi:hypothetical protein